MPRGTPPQLSGSGVDINDYQHWKPEVQARALELLEERQQVVWRPFYCTVPYCNGHPHCVPDINVECTDERGHPWTVDDDDWNLAELWHCSECGVRGTPVDKWQWEHARTDQHPPVWSQDWLTWLISGGRGSGKTRTGAEVTHRVTTKTGRIILIAPTGPDLRETMVEGVSGILACSPPGKRPLWEPSKKKLTWPNGCIALGYSAEEPERLRGPNSGFIWTDEPAHYPDTEAVMDNALFGMRVKDPGYKPKVVATTTPKPTKWVKETMKDKMTRISRASTYANMQNLAPVFKHTVLTKYEGTRTGQQELHGELLEDVEGALWNWNMFQRVDLAPAMLRIVVSVDPAGTANTRSDETGIIVIGVGFDKRLYVLEDLTGKYSPAGWATKAVKAHEKWGADAIVAEKNYGGDMVIYTLESIHVPGALKPRVLPVDSRRGKQIRAEPVVALYEKHKVVHVCGDQRLLLTELEAEQTEWVPNETPSPNRVDALVHGATELAKATMPAEMASPAQLTQLHAPTAGGFGGYGGGIPA